MERNEEARLLAIAAAVSEGADVDWDQAARAADSAHGQRVLRGLRVIDGVARLHRSGTGPDRSSAHQTSTDETSAHGASLGSESRVSASADAFDIFSAPDITDWAHLHILRTIGKGAFGTVYRAWDPRLEREVALKLLSPPRGTRVSLLLREARLLARVRHPNVVTVYGAEEVDGRIGIWMESLRGYTLDHWIREAGRLGPQEAALVGLAVCRALAAVHAAGLVHRDVKPRNVMREEGGRIVLMDFGAGSDLATTSGEPVEQAGTPLYMAPEIFRGERPTATADIYSLGVLIFQLVSLAYPVAGRTRREIQDAHARGERRRLRDARPDLPEAFVQTIERAIAPDPSKRFQSAGAFEEALASALGGALDYTVAVPHAHAPWWRRWALPALATIVAIVAGVWAWSSHRSRMDSSSSPRARFDLYGPHQSAIDTVSIAPDGSHVAFVAQGQLWVRPLDALEPRLLPGTSGANGPFWSPDSRHIAFFSGTKLKRIGVSGDDPRTICEARRPRGGTWSRAGVILFANALGAELMQAPAEGGEPSVVRTPDAARGDQEINWPAFLPDGSRYLYTARSRDPARAGIFVARLDASGSSGEAVGDPPKRVLDAASNAVYAAGSLIYVRRGTMFARRFDAARLEATGSPVAIVDRVDADAWDNGYAEFAASNTGQVVFRGGLHADRELRWFDRRGKPLSIVSTGTTGDAPIGEFRDFALSPDGARLAFDQLDPHSGRRDVWVSDLNTRATIRLTFDPDDDGDPVWSPDGQWIVFASNRGGQFGLYRKAADGSGAEEHLLDGQAVPLDWSRDGRSLAFEMFDQKTGTDLFLLPMHPPGQPASSPPSPAQVFLQTPFMEREAQFSPDGRWMAYSSSESSQRQIYLQTLPASGRRWQVSPGYGREPRWRADGRELFYLGPDDVLMAASVELGEGTVTIGTPRPLFRLRIAGGDVRQHYAVTADGQRIFVNTLVDGIQPSPMTLIVNALASVR